MANTGSIAFTVTAGAAGAVTIVGAVGSGGTIPDGNYQININQDNSGTVLTLATPLGSAQNSDIRANLSVDS